MTVADSSTNSPGISSVTGSANNANAGFTMEAMLTFLNNNPAMLQALLQQSQAPQSAAPPGDPAGSEAGGRPN